MKQNQCVIWCFFMNLINVTGTAALACSKSLPSPVCPSCREICILDVESREQSLIHPLVSCHSHGLCLHCLLHKATALKKWGPGTGLLVCGHSVPLAYCKARKNSRIIPSACIWPYTPARSRASLSALLRLEFCSTFRSCCLLRRWEPQSCG